MHTTQNKSIHAWITRRYLKLLLPLLQGQHPETGQTFLKDKQMEKAFSNEELKSESFSQELDPPEITEFSLGESPLLLAKITFKETKEEHPMLIMEPEEGSGIMLSYHPQMIKAMMNILQKAVAKADWSIDESFMHQMPANTTLQ